MSKPRVLCVDDEPNVLEGLQRHLRKGYAVVTAPGGEAGLAALAEHGPFAVVLSDMRMPAMTGAAFLAQVRQRAPETVRMLLTGDADVSAAIAAVNEGQIFRFLAKPCPPVTLLDAFTAAVKQHCLITSERVLLQQTLLGSIRALTEVLSLTNPVAFGRANRLRRYAGELAAKLELEQRWQVEIAAMLSQLGCVTLPPDTAEKHYHGQELTEDEQRLVAKMPEVVQGLLGHIPRLEPMLEILAQQNASPRADRSKRKSRSRSVPMASRILRVVSDYDTLETRGHPTQAALDTMRGRKDAYDGRVLAAFAELQGGGTQQNEIADLPAGAVRVGMVLAEDLLMRSGLVFVARGFEVTESFVQRVSNLEPNTLKEPVRVIVRNVGTSVTQASAERSVPKPRERSHHDKEIHRAVRR